MSAPALLWRSLDDNLVQCLLCAHFCRIAPGEHGLCAVRENRQGTLITLTRNKIAALHVDPIEKKPLFHFLPGTTTLSMGTQGCNLSCQFCQNWELSMLPRQGQALQGENISVQKIVDLAQNAGAASIAYTYSEPTIFFELMVETAAVAATHGLANIMVSNGYQSPQCLLELKDLIQAANIDLKAMDEKFYKEICGARLKPVLDNLVWIKKAGWHLEVTTLIIPGLNDSDQELEAIARFLYAELGPETPWHVSRFHPGYQMHAYPPTPLETLKRARDLGLAQGLKHIFVGNVPGSGLENTYCPYCGQEVIERQGFSIKRNSLNQGQCPQCQAQVL